MKYALFLAALLIAGNAEAADFKLTSPAFEDGGMLPESAVLNGFGCMGQNIAPALTWSNPPAGTKSFAVTLYDPDAPTGSGWWHWTVYNIPASERSLSATALPKGADQGLTDFGAAGYGGACPPLGDKPHRYIFTVHALKTDTLDLPATASGAFLGFNLTMNRIASAKLTALYGR
jgi:Raf kinase inhibitor-like YbhB/YbcL family protein